MTMTEMQIWRHKQSGDLFVVQVAASDDGEGWEIGDAVGPLHHSAIALALANGFDGDPELVASLEARPEDYVVEPAQ